MDPDQDTREHDAASNAPKPRLFSTSTLLSLAVVLIVCVSLTVYFLRQSDDITGPVAMGTHGWIAMGLGVVLSLAVGIGLMALVFFSARHGYDDRVQTRDDE